jgi:hypothetical protein
VTILEIQSLVKSLQLILAMNTGLVSENIDVHVYSGYPDMNQVEAVNRSYQTKEPVPAYAPDSFLGFVFSKPSIEQSKITIHALNALDEKGNPTNELWIKFKSPKSLSKAIANKDPESVHYEIDVKQLQQTVFDQLKIPAVNFDASPELIKQGPVWLGTPVKQYKKGNTFSLVLPVVETPLDVPERFAGHFYIKVVTKL